MTPLLLGTALCGCVILYALLGGADYGGGIWDLFASGPRKVEQRALIEHAIGPIWEANHVWLVLVVVVLFTAFRAACSRRSCCCSSGSSSAEPPSPSVPTRPAAIGRSAAGAGFSRRAARSRR